MPDLDRAGKMRGMPEKAGAYWAVWLVAAPNTYEQEENPSGSQEVVSVVVNCLDEDDPDHLRVLVPGVRESQPIENFLWLSGPLAEPGLHGPGLTSAHLPVTWEQSPEGPLILYANLSGQQRMPGEDGMIRMGAVHTMADGRFTVWTSCLHGIDGPPGSFATMAEAQAAFLAAIEGGARAQA